MACASRAVVQSQSGQAPQFEQRGAAWLNGLLPTLPIRALRTKKQDHFSGGGAWLLKNGAAQLGEFCSLSAEHS